MVLLFSNTVNLYNCQSSSFADLSLLVFFNLGAILLVSSPLNSQTEKQMKDLGRGKDVLSSTYISNDIDKNSLSCDFQTRLFKSHENGTTDETLVEALLNRKVQLLILILSVYLLMTIEGVILFNQGTESLCVIFISCLLMAFCASVGFVCGCYC